MRLKAPLLLLLICIGFFWKLALSNQYTWLESPDAAYQILPWLQFQAGEWHAGHMPLWDPYLWGGQPLLGQMITGAAYPLNWLLFLGPLRHGWIRQSWLHWYFVLIHFQAALFCYWLCRDLKRSRAGSMLAGLAFGLGGFIGTNNWPVMLNGAVWAPLVLLFFLRAVRGERPVSSAAWSGAFLGVAFLSGHHQIPVFIALAMAGAWIYYLASDFGKIKLLPVFGLFLALVAAFQALPAYEYGKLSTRWVGAENPVQWQDTVPYYVHQQFALYPQSILGIVIPGAFRNADPFIGLVALTLALLGLIGGWADRPARLFGGIAVGGLLFSLGHNSVFHGVMYAVLPMVEKARNPSMAIFIFHFGFCVLIAYGIDLYQESAARRAAWVAAGFGCLVTLVLWVLLVTKTPADERLGMVALTGFLLSAILLAWGRGRIAPQAATVALGLLMLLELGNVTTYGFPPHGDPKSLLNELTQHADIAAFLRDQYEPVRVQVDSNEIHYNFGDWYGIDQLGGYLASLTNNVYKVFSGTRAQMMYATNFYLGKQPIRPDQVEVFASRSGIKVYRNPGAFPAAWTVHEATGVAREEEMGRLLESESLDPHRQTFVRGTAPPLQKCQELETVSLLERQSGLVSLKADMKCRGMVIQADTYFPGWLATVDGRPAALYEAYGFLRGVVVEAGTHRVEIRYLPKSVYWGAALTALGLAGAGLLAAVKW